MNGVKPVSRLGQRCWMVRIGHQLPGRVDAQTAVLRVREVSLSLRIKSSCSAKNHN